MRNSLYKTFCSSLAFALLWAMIDERLHAKETKPRTPRTVLDHLRASACEEYQSHQLSPRVTWNRQQNMFAALVSRHSKPRKPAESYDLVEINPQTGRSQRILQTQTLQNPALCYGDDAGSTVSILSFKGPLAYCAQGRADGLTVRLPRSKLPLAIEKNLPMGRYKKVPSTNGCRFFDLEQNGTRDIDPVTMQSRLTQLSPSKGIPVYYHANQNLVAFLEHGSSRDERKLHFENATGLNHAPVYRFKAHEFLQMPGPILAMSTFDAATRVASTSLFTNIGNNASTLQNTYQLPKAGWENPVSFLQVAPELTAVIKLDASRSAAHALVVINTQSKLIVTSFTPPNSGTIKAIDTDGNGTVVLIFERMSAAESIAMWKIGNPSWRTLTDL